MNLNMGDLNMADVIKALGGNFDIVAETQPADYYEITRTLALHSFDKPCPFAKGAWVTPREDVNLKGAGEPHLVVSAYSTTLFQSQGEPGRPLIDYNMVVACVRVLRNGGMKYVRCFLGHSDDYEEYKGLVWGDGGEQS